MKAWVVVNRVAPWAKDPSVSTRGHEHIGRSDCLGSENEIAEFIQRTAPEVIGVEPYFIEQYPNPQYPDDDRNFYFLNGRDSRGYYTEVYVTQFVNG